MIEKPEIIIGSDPQKTVAALAGKFLEISIENQGRRFNVALSGGQTPLLLFDHLATVLSGRFDWSRIHFWWGDERCVPPDSADSNYYMTWQHLFSRIRIPEENIHRIKGENDPEAESQRYCDEITGQVNFDNNGPVFDLIILGMGDDGHTASIFPGQLHLFDVQSICAVSHHPVSGIKRITLTGHVLNNARNVYFLVTGKNKSRPVAEIIKKETSASLLPASHVQPNHGKLVWFIDQEAGALISGF